MFKVGDKVRVKAEVPEPTYDWGAVLPGDVGVITRLIDKNKFKVDFPAQKNWSAYPPEMELVEETKKLYTVKDIKGTRAYQQLKDSAENPFVLGMLVKRFLHNVNTMPLYSGKEEDRFLGLTRCFSWPESPEGNKFWNDIYHGRIKTLAHLQAFNKPKAKKPKVVPEPIRVAPPAPAIQQAVAPAPVQPAIGRGERPDDATHWTEEADGRWLKVDAQGIIYHWANAYSEWMEYGNQEIGQRRVANAVALDVIPKKGAIPAPPKVKAAPKPAVPEQPVIKKAPRIGWW